MKYIPFQGATSQTRLAETTRYCSSRRRLLGSLHLLLSSGRSSPPSGCSSSPSFHVLQLCPISCWPADLDESGPRGALCLLVPEELNTVQARAKSARPSPPCLIPVSLPTARQK
eukprot:scaffold35127_cov69-Phaeocystis_antarctica.AAC.1